MSLKAALFDFDGTLVRSDPAHLAAYNEALAPYGQQLTQHQYDRQVIGRTNAEIFAGLLPEANDLTIEQLALAKETAYLSRIHLVETQDGARSVLQQLQAKDVRTALVTNAPRHVVLDLVERFGFLPYLDTIVTSSDVRHGKPHPEPYQHALTALGLTPMQGIAIEDSETGRQSAEAAGLPVLLLDTGLAHLSATNLVSPSARIDSLYDVLERFHCR